MNSSRTTASERAKMKSPRILLIDIETAPIEAHVWQMKLWNTNVGQEQLLSDMFILSYAAKWLNEKEIFYDDQSDRRSIRDDTHLLKSMYKLLDSADIVVVQNGVAFDIPTIKARMLAKNILPPSPFKVIDTCLLAKKTFNFSYNSLGFLAKAMGCKINKNPHKEFPGMKLWNECLKGNKKAWKEMRVYNIDDVLVLEEVYLKMRPWIDGHPNVGNYQDVERPVCPKCGGTVERRGTAYTQTGQYTKYHCLHCGGYSRGRQLTSGKEHRKHQLVN
jgi:hypothetical protein